MRVTMKIPDISWGDFHNLRERNYYFLALEMIFFSYYQPPLIISPRPEKNLQGTFLWARIGNAHHCVSWRDTSLRVVPGKNAFPLPCCSSTHVLLLPMACPRWGSPPRPSCGDLPPPGRGTECQNRLDMPRAVVSGVSVR